MKKFVTGFIVGAIICSMLGAFAVSYVANPVNFKVLVNGEEFVSDPPALEVNGRTYLPLRAMGEALGVPVNWNQELFQAEVGITSNFEPIDVYNYIIVDVWNNGFWFLDEYINGDIDFYKDMYIETFADSYDEEIDVNKIVAHILETKTTIDMYNNTYKSSDKWQAFYKEYNRLYDLVQSGTYNQNNYSTTFFVKVRDDFCDELLK